MSGHISSRTTIDVQVELARLRGRYRRLCELIGLLPECPSTAEAQSIVLELKRLASTEYSEFTRRLT